MQVWNSARALVVGGSIGRPRRAANRRTDIFVYFAVAMIARQHGVNWRILFYAGQMGDKCNGQGGWRAIIAGLNER